MKLSNWMISEIEKGNVPLDDLTKKQVRQYRRHQQMKYGVKASLPQALISFLSMIF